MKSTITLFCFLIFIVSSYSQTKDELLAALKANKFKSTEKIEKLDEAYKITNIISGRTTYKNLNNYIPKTVGNKNQVDTTKIYPDLVDTTQFTGMYEFWTSVPVGSDAPPGIVIGDINNNNKTELYGMRYRSFPPLNKRSMYEYNPDTKRFEYKTDMPWDSISTYGDFRQIYDINNDGEKNLFINGTYQTIDSIPGINVGRTFKVNDTTSLPTEILFDYKQFNQMNDPLWGEYDKREGSDLFYCAESYDLRVAAARYDENTNTTSTVYVYPVPEDIFYLAGLTNHDIDGDGYADLSTGGLRGDIVIFEYDENIQNYRDVWYGDGGTYNVYIHFNTNDIDGNGKKEIWVGGAAFYNDVPITRLSCLEAIGNNQYETKHVIDIVGIFSLSANNGFSVDINKDATEEIGLCLGDTFMILKFTGEENEWSFELFYMKLNNIENSQYFGATMYDLDTDGFEELLVMMDDDPPGFGNRILLTRVFKPTDLVSVEESESIAISYNLYQNYPNPFNPITNIEYEIPKTSNVKIEVYNILGEKIVELVNKEQSHGNYRITFDGSSLPSGLYIIKMTTGKYNKTIKSLLIK
jgi:hypothetical protein